MYLFSDVIFKILINISNALNLSWDSSFTFNPWKLLFNNNYDFKKKASVYANSKSIYIPPFKLLCLLFIHIKEYVILNSNPQIDFYTWFITLKENAILEAPVFK